MDEGSGFQKRLAVSGIAATSSAMHITHRETLLGTINSINGYREQDASPWPFNNCCFRYQQVMTLA